MVLGIIWATGKKPLQPKRYNWLQFTAQVRQQLGLLFAEHGEALGRDVEDVQTRKDRSKTLAYCHSHVVGAQHNKRQSHSV